MGSWVQASPEAGAVLLASTQPMEGAAQAAPSWRPQAADLGPSGRRNRAAPDLTRSEGQGAEGIQARESGEELRTPASSHLQSKHFLCAKLCQALCQALCPALDTPLLTELATSPRHAHRGQDSEAAPRQEGTQTRLPTLSGSREPSRIGPRLA